LLPALQRCSSVPAQLLLPRFMTTPPLHSLQHTPSLHPDDLPRTTRFLR
jgi:hypothetical protein